MDRSFFTRSRFVLLLAGSLVLATVGVASAAAPTKTTTSWAEVLYTGTIQAQSGGISVTTSGAGLYLVNFGKDVTRCAIVVTSGIAGENGLPVAGVNAVVASNANADPNLTPAVIRVISTNFDGPTGPAQTEFNPYGPPSHDQRNTMPLSRSPATALF